jgi:AcrR family transcriptional regulator
MSDVVTAPLAERAVAAGREILEESGDPAQVTMRGVARRVGVAAPSLYRYFETVEHLRRAAVDVVVQDFLRVVTPALDLDATPEEAITAFVRAYIAYARRHPAAYRMLVGESEIVHDIPEASAWVAVVGARGRELLGEALGEDPAGTVVSDVGLSSWLELHGIASLPVAHLAWPWPDDEELISSFVARTVGAARS